MQPLSENAVNVPAFLSKLWKMVNDPSTNHLISWSAAGNSFIIQNQAQFWYELLPLYYKHNNMSSFVRQLNMYGFHKMTTVENGTMDIDKDEIQFYHPYFQKDQPEMLREIKRKVTGTKTVASEGYVPSSIKTDVTKVLADVKQLRSHQQTVDSQLSAIKQENAVLWRELAMLRQKHMKQQQIVNKLIQFLVTIVQPSNRMSGLGVKRRYPLMIHGTPHKKSKTKNSRSTSVGPTIHELDTEVVSDDLFEVSDDTQQQVQSPTTPIESSQKTPPDNLFDDVNINSVGSVSPDIFLDSPELEYSQQHEEKPEFISIDEFLDDPTSETNEDAAVIDSLQKAVTEEIEESNKSSNKVFLNPSAQDTLLCNLICGNYNTSSLKVQEKDKTPGKSLTGKNNLTNSVNQLTEATTATNEDNTMAIATRDSSSGNDYKRLTM
ncbi:heat shock factor protein isoform X2 [Agrilus planipennis]|uniref:Heat shock factor protein isoform X2 n=1 Tax=Agrilus planipennis TaxID=224129 RepID=A0A7F5RN27_AGRPL|nr:heat shock factor protein isoform X2 [Agrilus planipennis]